MDNVVVSLLSCFLSAWRVVLSAVPPDVCFQQFKWEDCGMPPQAVMYYYKSGSRCEVGFWRGCLPNPNMFADEYECVQTCILAPRAKPEHYHHYDIIGDEGFATAVQTTTVEPSTTIMISEPDVSPEHYTSFCLKEHICNTTIKEYYRVDDSWVHIKHNTYDWPNYVNLHFAMKGKKKFTLLLADSDLTIVFEVVFLPEEIVVYRNREIVASSNEPFFYPNVLTAIGLYIKGRILEVNLENPYPVPYPGVNKQWNYGNEDFNKVRYFSFASGKKGESVFFEVPCFTLLPSEVKLLYLKQDRNYNLHGSLYPA